MGKMVGALQKVFEIIASYHHFAQLVNKRESFKKSKICMMFISFQS